MSAQQVEAPIETSLQGDALTIRLTGRLDAASVPALRAVLLRSRPDGCDDVLVDASGVESVDDAALAVLLAAPVWAEATGARFAYRRLSSGLTEVASAAGVEDLMPQD